MDWDDLLQRLGANDQRGWQELQDYLFRSALGLLRPVAARREVAEDLAQQVAALVWQHLADFQSGEHLRNWAQRVLRQRVADHCRNPRRAQDPQGGEGAAAGQEMEISGREADPSAHAEEEESLRRLAECIELLPQPHRSVVKLRQAGWTFEEIAGLLGWKGPSGPYQCENQAHALLRQCLEDAAPETGPRP